MHSDLFDSDYLPQRCPSGSNLPRLYCDWRGGIAYADPPHPTSPFTCVVVWARSDVSVAIARGSAFTLMLITLPPVSANAEVTPTAYFPTLILQE